MIKERRRSIEGRGDMKTDRTKVGCEAKGRNKRDTERWR